MILENYQNVLTSLIRTLQQGWCFYIAETGRHNSFHLLKLKRPETSDFLSAVFVPESHIEILARDNEHFQISVKHFQRGSVKEGVVLCFSELVPFISSFIENSFNDEFTICDDASEIEDCDVKQDFKPVVINHSSKDYDSVNIGDMTGSGSSDDLGDMLGIFEDEKEKQLPINKTLENPCNSAKAGVDLPRTRSGQKATKGGPQGHTRKEKSNASIQCKDCNRVYSNELSLKQHFRKNHQLNMGYKRYCWTCWQFFETVKGYERHKRDFHPNIKRKVPVCRTWECSFCLEKFDSKASSSKTSGDCLCS